MLITCVLNVMLAKPNVNWRFFFRQLPRLAGLHFSSRQPRFNLEKSAKSGNSGEDHGVSNPPACLARHKYRCFSPPASRLPPPAPLAHSHPLPSVARQLQGGSGMTCFIHNTSQAGSSSLVARSLLGDVGYSFLSLSHYIA